MVTFLLPSGPKNLQALFPGIDFSQVEEYYIELLKTSDASVMATTNTFKRACCCNGDTIRLFFVNYLGAVDAVNLQLQTITTDVKSTRWKKGLRYPLQKYDGGLQRSNVTGLVNVQAESACFEEQDQDFLEELLASPNAWIQWKGTQGQNDDYLPVVIEDGKFLKRKQDERWIYPLQVQFTMANDKIILRN